jgi:hypothetical protein
MIRATLVALALLSACGVANAAEPEKPVPVAAVTFIVSYPRPDEKIPRRLITGVWSDGTVVTSANRQTGGPPYTSRKVDPTEVKKLGADLDALKFYTDEELKKQPNRYPPDASYTAVAATFGEKRQRLALWRAPTTQPADADRFVQVFIKARALINRLGEGEKGELVETIDEKIFAVGRKPR